MTETTRVARHSRKLEPAGRATTNAATDVASGTNRVMLGARPREPTAEGWGSKEEMTDGEEKEATGERKDVTMTETANPTTT